MLRNRRIGRYPGIAMLLGGLVIIGGGLTIQQPQALLIVVILGAVATLLGILRLWQERHDQTPDPAPHQIQATPSRIAIGYAILGALFLFGLVEFLFIPFLRYVGIYVMLFALGIAIVLAVRLLLNR